jgi:hypothetical protein
LPRLSFTLSFSPLRLRARSEILSFLLKGLVKKNPLSRTVPLVGTEQDEHRSFIRLQGKESTQTNQGRDQEHDGDQPQSRPATDCRRQEKGGGEKQTDDNKQHQPATHGRRAAFMVGSDGRLRGSIHG